MKPEEKSSILSKWNAAIVAPAGHGKTEMIVDLVAEADGKSLIVTHTNAGVEAVRNRLKSKGIDSKKYSIATIAGFCLRWSRAYSHTANYIKLTVGNEDVFYERLYDGTAKIFENDWARQVIRRTYRYVFVDEYQDCSVRQHRIFENINKTVPVIIFGDPLQAIFGWADELISWNNLCFEKVDVETYPWRWKETKPELGNYITSIRSVLERGIRDGEVQINVEPVGDCISVIQISSGNYYPIKNMVNNYDRVVYIASNEIIQLNFSCRMARFFQNDEPQDLKTLYETAIAFDETAGFDRAIKLIQFLECIATHVKTELKIYKQKLINKNCDFDKIKKHIDFGDYIRALCQEQNSGHLLAVLDWLKSNNTFKIFRKELFDEMIRAIKYSIENHISILESAQKIRMMPSLQHRYHRFRMLSSRTVLSKGLEFDCVIIDLKGGMSVTDYYVALTRARRKVIIISDQPKVKLKGVQTKPHRK